MANPSELRSNIAATIRATPIVQTLLLNGDRSYTFAHDGEDRDGTTSTSKIYLCVSGNLIKDDTEEVGKIKLLASRSVGVGPGLLNVQYACSGNGNATMLVDPNALSYGMF
jgi:hypothetical protein